MEEYTTVELTLDDGEVLECLVLTTLEAGEYTYIALLPLDDNGDPEDDSDVYLYRYSEGEDGEPVLENIQDDDEFEIASDALDEWFDTLEYEEMDD
jgi:uncharacterized protein YrzB (UPF0473 family)